MSQQSTVSYNIESALLQELVNYLANRPYAEVSGLVNKLMQTVEAQNQAYLAANPIVSSPAETVGTSEADATLAPAMVAKIKKARKDKLTAVPEVNDGSAQG